MKIKRNILDSSQPKGNSAKISSYKGLKNSELTNGSSSNFDNLEKNIRDKSTDYNSIKGRIASKYKFEEMQKTNQI